MVATGVNSSLFTMSCFPSSFAARLLAVILALTAPAAASEGLRTLLLSGQQAPGFEADVTFQGVGNISAGNARNNDFAFVGSLALSGDGQPATPSIWSSTSDGLTLIARLGEPAPGGPDGAVFARRFNMRPGTDGNFGALQTSAVDLDSDLNFGPGIWVRDEFGSLRLAIRNGISVPDANGDDRFRTRSVDIGSTAASGQGHAAAVARLVDNMTGNFQGDGLYRFDPEGGLSLVARQSEQAPKVPAGLRFHEFDGLTFSRDGTLLFKAHLFDATNSRFESSLWSQRKEEPPSLIAMGGNPAPGTEPGVVYDSFDFPGLPGPTQTGSGHFVYRATLTGPDIGPTNNQGLWFQRRDGQPELLVRSGVQPPGHSADSRFVWFDMETINDFGQVVFRAGVDDPTAGTSNVGLWKALNSNDLELISSSGEQAPGVDPDVVFRAFFANKTNRHGQAVVYGFLGGPGVNTENDRGIWAEDRLGELQYVTRMGDQLDVSDDPHAPDLRTVLRFGIGGINDQGQVLFRANFSDGTSGIFLSNVAAVPEPASASLLVLFVGRLAAWRIKRSNN